MAITQGKIGLTIREQAKKKKTLVKYDPKSVQKWVDALPMANIGEVSRSLYQMITEFNTTKVSCDNRYKCLLIFDKIVEYVSHALRKHYLGHSVGLSDKQRKIATLAQALDTEMAFGYKAVLEQAAARNFLFRDKKVVAAALYGSMNNLRKILTRCYQLYTNPPKGLWREIHLLFSYAIKHRYQNTAIPGSEQKHKQDIESLYLKIILLTLVNPYQLRQKDIELIYVSLNALINMIGLEKSRDVNDEYMVDLDSDSPPIYHELEQNESLGEHILKIDTTDLLSYLKEQLRRVPDDSSQLTGYGNYALSPIILRHLVDNLGKAVNRSFSRSPGKGLLRVAIGLATTHYMISETAAESKQAEDETEAEPSDLNDYAIFGDLANASIEGYTASMGDGVQDTRNRSGTVDPWADVKTQPAVKLSTEMVTTVKSTELPNQFIQQDKKLNYTLVDANIINTSPGGYCLALTAEIPHQTEAGEIVGILNFEGDSSHWSLATIRWMKSKANNTLLLGIQLISPRLIPVSSQVRNSKMDAQSFQRSLLIPAIKGLGQPETLLTPPVPYRTNQKVKFIRDEKEHMVQLTKLIQSSHSYKQFEFEPVKSGAGNTDNSKAAKKKPRTNPSKLDQNDDFDSVWDIL